MNPEKDDIVDNPVIPDNPFATTAAFTEETKDLVPQAEVPPEALKASPMSLSLTKDEVDKHLDGDVNRRLFYNEMQACDMYLHNIHKSFKYANSIHGVTHLVKTALSVQKHRRALMHYASHTAGHTDYDIMGNEVKKLHI